MKMKPQELESIREDLNNPHNQEFNRKTVWLLMRHIEALELEWQQDTEGYVAAGEKMIESITRLHCELRMERERKKVAVPKEVAVALYGLKEGGYTPGGILHHQRNPDWAEDYHDELRIVKQFIDSDPVYSPASNIDTLILALVFGDTVEPTKEERFYEEIGRICDEWSNKTFPGKATASNYLAAQLLPVAKAYSESTN